MSGELFKILRYKNVNKKNYKFNINNIFKLADGNAKFWGIH